MLEGEHGVGRCWLCGEQPCQRTNEEECERGVVSLQSEPPEFVGAEHGAIHHSIERGLTHVESTPLGATMESPQTHGPQPQGAALMTHATKYVALDVHQATTLASVRAETGQVIARTILPTEAPAVVEFFRGLRSTVHVAF